VVPGDVVGRRWRSRTAAASSRLCSRLPAPQGVREVRDGLHAPRSDAEFLRVAILRVIRRIAIGLMVFRLATRDREYCVAGLQVLTWLSRDGEAPSNVASRRS
jgi:hypothetical protein